MLLQTTTLLTLHLWGKELNYSQVLQIHFYTKRQNSKYSLSYTNSKGNINKKRKKFEDISYRDLQIGKKNNTEMDGDKEDDQQFKKISEIENPQEQPNQEENKEELNNEQNREEHKEGNEKENTPEDNIKDDNNKEIIKKEENNEEEKNENEEHIN